MRQTDAPVMLISKFSVSLEGKMQVFEWLNAEHCREIVSQAGFLYSKRVKLEQDDGGWECYLMLYALESRDALNNYFANKPLQEKFLKEQAPFAHHLRIERWWGMVEATFDH